METSVLIQVPYELESAYSPLEERTDIDYTVMSVDNFNVGDFLIGLYITISSNSIITGVVSGMIWDVIKIVSHDVLDKLRQSSKEKTSEKISEQPNKEDGEQETCIKVSLCVRENSKDEYRIGAEYRFRRRCTELCRVCRRCADSRTGRRCRKIRGDERPFLVRLENDGFGRL